MPRALLVYFSQGGTTTRVAERIAVGLRATGYRVDLCNLKDGRPPEAAGYDLLGVGSPVYYFRPPFKVMDYVNALPDLVGLPAFVFLMHGTYRWDAGNQLRRVLAGRGTREVGYLHCRGADYFLGYLKLGYLFSPDHPTPEELARAERFGQKVAARAAGKKCPRAEDDPSPEARYRLERLLVSRWLVRQLYSRLFRVDAKRCSGCGLCIKMCPTRNITEGKGGRPVWGRECLLCLTCERKCPKDAVTSPVSWPLFRPFLIYNVHHASHDPSLDYARVTHRRGVTRREEDMIMARLQLLQTVQAPSGVVFDLVDNHENYTQLFHGFSKFEWATPRHQVGTRLKMEAKAAGIAMPMELETTEVVKDCKIAGVYISGLKGSWEWLFEPVGDATKVTFTSDYELPLGILGQIADRALVERETRSNMEKTLATIKEKVEAGRPVVN